MRKPIVLSILAAVVMLFTLPGATFAQGPPLPSVFGGKATIDGNPPSDGTAITAWIDGTQVASANVSSGGYSMIVAQKPGGNFVGKEVRFKIGGSSAIERSVWGPGGGEELDLTATSGDTVPQVGETQPAPQTTEECVLREGMQVQLQNVLDTIEKERDGHLELSFRNPAVNSCTVEADLRITVPQNIIVIGKEGVSSGGAGTLNAVVKIPEGGERVLAMDLKGMRKGSYIMSFRGTYWPQGNKDLYQPITLQQTLTVIEPSADQSIPPTEQKVANGTAGQPGQETSPDKPSGLLEESGGMPIWIIVLIVLVVLVVLVALVAIVGMGRRGGG